MKNFQKLADNVNILPLMHELTLHPDLWNENTLRTSHAESAHREVSDIWVWFNSIDPDDLKKAVDDKEAIPYRAWRELPSVRPIVFALMNQVAGVRLGRVLITKLPPGKTITWHKDGGAPAEYYSRYQVALQSLPGALFHIEDETVCFRSGEVWFINNKANHSVVNNSKDDRIVLIVDIRNG